MLRARFSRKVSAGEDLPPKNREQLFLNCNRHVLHALNSLNRKAREATRNRGRLTREGESKIINFPNGCREATRVPHRVANSREQRAFSVDAVLVFICVERLEQCGEVRTGTEK